MEKIENNYSNLSICSEDFCENCDQLDLEVSTELLYMRNRPIPFNKVQCKHLDKCRELYEHLAIKISNNALAK